MGTRFILTDVHTDAVLGELPIESATFGGVLNGPGFFKGTLPLAESGLIDIPDAPGAEGVAQGTAAVQPPTVLAGRQALYVESDGVLIWGGPVWTYTADVASNTGTLGAEGMFSLLRGRRLETTYSAVARDQHLIVKDLIDEIQSYTDGDVLIDTSSLTAYGTARSAAWLAAERKDVGEAIEQLAAVRGGFDFAVGVRWGSDRPERFFTITSPTAQGRETSLVLDLDKNLELLGVSFDATTLAATVYGLGAQLEDGTVLSTQQSNLGGPYLRRDAVVSHPDVTALDTLEGHAGRALDRGASPITLPTVALHGPALGSFEPGDIVELRGSYGAIDITGRYRITNWTATFATSGSATVMVTLAPLEAFA